ncbi:MAG: 2OG-Fe(II) oxygenase superfamily protein [Massilia sp.]|nr:2OG-Fe(II) oxygenase superfamily protein [Massilia sp.]
MRAHIQIKPQLRDWLAHNIRRGVPPAPLVQAMTGQGFDPALAGSIAAVFWSAIATGTDLPGPTISAEQIADAAYRYPPSPLAGANSIVAGDRSVPVVLRLAQPSVVLLDKVLSDAECDQLIAAATPRLKRSTIVDPVTGKDSESATRSSEGMFFRLAENALVERLDLRLSALMQMPLEHGEGLQVLRYPVGAQSTPHYDFLMPTSDANCASLSRSGQRVSTLIVYLNEVERGGETVFPECGMEVAPRRGSALYFEYCNADGQLDPLSLHAGAPVAAGEKWIVTKWMRQRPFVSA